MKHALSRLDLTIRPFGLEAPRIKRSKFNVDRSAAGIAKRTVDNILFDSVAEAKRYCELKLLEKAGYIRQLELQPEFRFEIDGKLMFKYIADFRYFEGSQRVVEDVKSKPTKTREYRIKKKIVESTYHIKVTEVEA